MQTDIVIDGFYEYAPYAYVCSARMIMNQNADLSSSMYRYRFVQSSHAAAPVQLALALNVVAI